MKIAVVAFALAVSLFCVGIALKNESHFQAQKAPAKVIRTG